MFSEDFFVEFPLYRKTDFYFDPVIHDFDFDRLKRLIQTDKENKEFTDSMKKHISKSSK